MQRYRRLKRMCRIPLCRNRYVNGCQILNPNTTAYGTRPNHVCQKTSPARPKSSAESSCSTKTETQAIQIVFIAGGKYSVRSNRYPYPRRKTGVTVTKSKGSSQPSQSHTLQLYLHSKFDLAHVLHPNSISQQ